MSEPTSNLQFKDLLTRIAKIAGVAYYGTTGNSRVMPPIDVHDLDMCKDVVNDGIRMFISDAPEVGWRWKRRILAVNLTGTRVTGTADTASSTTLDDSVLAAAYDADDDLNDWYIYITGGTGEGSYAKITDYDYQTGTITAFADYGDASHVTVTSASHGLTDGETVTISGTTNYDGSYIVSGATTHTFRIVATWVANDATGTWKYAQITVAGWLDVYGNSGGTSPAADSTYAITTYETVGGDIARYPLPENFNGEVSGKIQYQKDTTTATDIHWAHEETIRALRSVSVETGTPELAAIRPLEPVAGQLGPTRRKELIVDPQPSSDVVVEFPYSVEFDKLDAETGIADSGGDTSLVDATRTEGNDYFKDWIITIINGTGKGSYAVVTVYTGSSGTFTVGDWLTAAGAGGGTNPGADSIYYVEPANNFHPAGQAFDQTILAACLFKAAMEFENVNQDYIEMYHKKDLVQAYAADARLAPRVLGRMGGVVIRERSWEDVNFTS